MNNETIQTSEANRNAAIILQAFKVHLEANKEPSKTKKMNKEKEVKKILEKIQK